MKSKIKKITCLFMSFHKKNWFKLSIFIILCSLVAFLFFESNMYIKYTFNKAFNCRLAGDCMSFKGYLAKDINNWYTDCEKEKNVNSSVDNFKIQNISHTIGDKVAFLQVELSYRGKKYSVNYEMIKQGVKWAINENKARLN